MSCVSAKGWGASGRLAVTDFSFLCAKVHSGHQKTKREKIRYPPVLIYDMYVNAGTVYFRLSAGSEANIKPDLVMDDIWHRLVSRRSRLLMKSIVQSWYADLGKNGKRKPSAALGDLGTGYLWE